MELFFPSSLKPCPHHSVHLRLSAAHRESSGQSQIQHILRNITAPFTTHLSSWRSFQTMIQKSNTKHQLGHTFFYGRHWREREYRAAARRIKKSFFKKKIAIWTFEKCFKNAFYKNLWNTRGQEPFLILCTRTWQRQPAWRLGSLFCVSEVGSIASNPAENFSPRVLSTLLDSSPTDSTQSPRVGPEVSPFYIEENVVSEKCISVFQFWVRILSGFCVSREGILLYRIRASSVHRFSCPNARASCSFAGCLATPAGHWEMLPPLLILFWV